jgi:hypothetical protein
MTTLTQTLDQVMMQWSKLNEAIIKPQLIKASGRGWLLSINEHWQSVDDAGNPYHSSNLDEQIKWAVEQLEDKARRIAWNIWKFKNKRDAEKFITVYYLVWAK